MKVKRKLSLSAVAAALAMLLLVAGAIAAANSFGLLDFMRKGGTEPLKGAEDTIQTVQKNAAAELFSATVEQAYCDGASFAVTVRVEADDPERYALVDFLGDALAGDQFETEILYNGPAPEHPAQNQMQPKITHKAGKQILNVSAPNLEINGEPHGDTLDVTINADGSLTYLVEGALRDTTQAPLACRISLAAWLDEQLYAVEPLEFALGESAPDLLAELVPSAPGERYRIESARLTGTRPQTTLEVVYTYAPAAGEDMGLDIIPFDAEGNRIPTDHASFDQETLDDGTLRCRLSVTLKAFELQSDKLTLQGKVIGEDVWLEPVACSVVMP